MKCTGVDLFLLPVQTGDRYWRIGNASGLGRV
jgi:hypothetical protein